MSEIETALWNDEQDPSDDVKKERIAVILEQYKVCVQAADKISDRRGSANSFFLSINTAIVGTMTTFLKDETLSDVGPLLVAAIVICIAWVYLLHSYRGLNSAKFEVIGLLEKRLPASPIWNAEWKLLGEGKKLSKYAPLGFIETVVPLAFVVLYLYLALTS